MPEKSKDCLACQLVSGGGLLLGGTYVIYHSKNAKKFSKIIAMMGYGLGALGILRIFSLPPFRKSQIQKDDRTTDKAEQRLPIKTSGASILDEMDMQHDD